MAVRGMTLLTYSGEQTDATFTRERGHPARRSVPEHAWPSGAIPRRGDLSPTAFALSRPWRAGMPALPARRSHSTAHRYKARRFDGQGRCPMMGGRRRARDLTTMIVPRPPHSLLAPRNLLLFCGLLLASPAAAAQAPARGDCHVGGSRLDAARAAEERGDWAAALAQYLQASEQAPRCAELLVNLGVTYNRLGRAEDAVAAFRRAASLAPHLTAAHLNLGVTFFRARRYEEAEAPLARAVELDPEGAQARQLLALTLVARERFAEAAAHLERLRQRDGSDRAVLSA